MRGRLEQKVTWLETAAGLITDKVDPDRQGDTWTSWNITRDLGNSILEDDVETTIDRLCDLMLEIGAENGVMLTPQGHDWTRED